MRILGMANMAMGSLGLSATPAREECLISFDKALIGIASWKADIMRNLRMRARSRTESPLSSLAAHLQARAACRAS